MKEIRVRNWMAILIEKMFAGNIIEINDGNNTLLILVQTEFYMMISYFHP
jgi:hypothetical protein